MVYIGGDQRQYSTDINSVQIAELYQMSSMERWAKGGHAKNGIESAHEYPMNYTVQQCAKCKCYEIFVGHATKYFGQRYAFKRNKYLLYLNTPFSTWDLKVNSHNYNWRIITIYVTICTPSYNKYKWNLLHMRLYANLPHVWFVLLEKLPK